MLSKKVIALIIIVIIIIGGVVAFVLTQKKKEPEPIIDNVRTLYLSVNDKNYTLICWGGPLQLFPNTVRWQIRDKNNTVLMWSNLPTVSGASGSITSNNVTVTWLDQDNDGYLSNFDKIIIHTQPDNYDFGNCTFLLTYIPTGGTLTSCML